MDVPVLYSNSTHWTAKPFMTLYDFLKIIKKDDPDFSELALHKMKEQRGIVPDQVKDRNVREQLKAQLVIQTAMLK